MNVWNNIWICEIALSVCIYDYLIYNVQYSYNELLLIWVNNLKLEIQGYSSSQKNPALL